jgi:hypothetical protein
MFTLGVILVALAVLGSLTALALRAGSTLSHPDAWTAALAGMLVLGLILLAD